MKLDLSGYKKWLKQEGYQPTTIASTLRRLRDVASMDPDDVQPHHRAHIQRYLRYVETTRRQPLGSKFTRWMRLRAFDASVNRRRHGRRTKDPLNEKEWRFLRKRLRTMRDDPVARLLIAYMYSPYRVSEFLNMPLSKIEVADVQDKLSRDWLLDRPGLRVYDALCTTERCAYSRLRRKLQLVCADLGYRADLDTLYKSFHELRSAA